MVFDAKKPCPNIDVDIHGLFDKSHNDSSETSDRIGGMSELIEQSSPINDGLHTHLPEVLDC